MPLLTQLGSLARMPIGIRIGDLHASLTGYETSIIFHIEVEFEQF
jgi:hypothetical protein